VNTWDEGSNRIQAEVAGSFSKMHLTRLDVRKDSSAILKLLNESFSRMVQIFARQRKVILYSLSWINEHVNYTTAFS
jgi:hypothetical protein